MRTPFHRVFCCMRTEETCSMVCQSRPGICSNQEPLDHQRSQPSTDSGEPHKEKVGEASQLTKQNHVGRASDHVSSHDLMSPLCAIWPIAGVAQPGQGRRGRAELAPGRSPTSPQLRDRPHRPQLDPSPSRAHSFRQPFPPFPPLPRNLCSSVVFLTFSYHHNLRQWSDPGKEGLRPRKRSSWHCPLMKKMTKRKKSKNQFSIIPSKLGVCTYRCDRQWWWIRLPLPWKERQSRTDPCTTILADSLSSQIRE